VTNPKKEIVKTAFHEFKLSLGDFDRYGEGRPTKLASTKFASCPTMERRITERQSAEGLEECNCHAIKPVSSN
jgi:hypothetical protein